MIRTEKLCYNYTSSDPFNAEILELRTSGSGEVIALLDKSIFYPEGGGQPADRGTINNVPVLNVLENDGEMLHVLKDGGNLKPGPAELVLDARRRRELTQLHTGQHLLSGIIFKMTGARTVSMHLGDDTYTIDVDTDSSLLSEETLIDVEDAVDDAIEENHPVIVHLCPPEDLSSFPLRRLPPNGGDIIRVIDIGRHDIIACCGTHVKSTAEIGLFRILGAEKYKGLTRISFLAGRRLLLNARLLRKNAVIASQALSVPLSEIGRGVLNLAEKLARSEKQLKELEEKATREKAKALIQKASAFEYIHASNSNPAVVIESFADEDLNELINIGKIAQKQTKAVFILVSCRELKFAAFSSIAGFDLRQFLLESFNALGGKGGGSLSFFQGSFGTKEAMDAFLMHFTG